MRAVANGVEIGRFEQLLVMQSPIQLFENSMNSGPDDVRRPVERIGFVLEFPDPPSRCAEGVGVWMGLSPWPFAGIGFFPSDPAFNEVTMEDIDPGPAFEHAPPSGDGTVYYLVAEDLPANDFGPSGHYGF